MRKSKNFLLALGLILLVVCGILWSETGNGKEGEKTFHQDVITLTMFIQNKSKYTGLQEDPVAQYVKEKFGIQIELTMDASLGNTSSDGETYSQLLKTKLVSNDLDDIMDFGSITEYPETLNYLKKAVKGGLILPLDELVKKEGDSLHIDPRLKIRNEYRRKYIYEDGHYYSLGGAGGIQASSLPDGANWVRWDLYSKLGYPNVRTDDEFLTLLAQMQATYQITPRGEKVYALGGAFAEEQGVGDAFLMMDYPMSKGYEPMDGNYAVYFNHGEKKIEAPLLEEDSFFWNGVAFYYKANQKGLLDPEAKNMYDSQYSEKINKGIYLAALRGSQVMDKESILAGRGMKDAGYMPLNLLEDVVSAPIYQEAVFGENELVISKDCKYPQKALEFLNWCFSEEGSRIITQGTKGLAWEEKEGEPVLMDTYKKDAALGITDMAETYGKEKYIGINGFKSNVLDRKGSFIQPEKNEDPKSYSAVKRDALSYYETNSFLEYFTEYRNREGKELPSVRWSAYQEKREDLPDQIQGSCRRINQYMYKSILKCVYARDEKEYQMIKKEIIEETKKLGVEKVVKWYQEHFEEWKEEMDPLMEEALMAYGIGEKKD